MNDAHSRGIQKATKDDSGYFGSVSLSEQNDDDDDKTQNNRNRTT